MIGIAGALRFGPIGLSIGLLSACAGSTGNSYPYEGSGNGSGAAEGSGNSASSGSQSGRWSGTGSSTGRAATGMPSTGSSSGSGSGAASAGSVLDAAIGSGSQSGGSGALGDASTSGSAIHDSGAAHRDAAPVVLTGCAAQVPNMVFATSCVAASCHNSKDKAYLLDLQTPGIAARLVNQPSIQEPSIMLVDPNVPSRSYLLLKVELAQPPAGLQMPQMGAKLSQAQVSCLQQWVTAEAAGPY